MSDNLQSLMDEILTKNDKYFPGWEKMSIDGDHDWKPEEVEWLMNQMMHVYWTNAIAGEGGELASLTIQMVKEIILSNAISSETGELANFAKKYMREALNWGGKKLTYDEYRNHVAEELADIFIYLVLYSKVMDIDLVRAVRIKTDENYKERFKVE